MPARKKAKCYDLLWFTGNEEPYRQQGANVLPLLPADHPEWPNVPYEELPTGEKLIRAGPTLEALFGNDGPLSVPDKVAKVCLLYQPGEAEPGVETLRGLACAIAKARCWSQDVSETLCASPIEGITDPANPSQVMEALATWLSENKQLKGSGEVHIDLRQMTATMRDCWKKLWRNKAFRSANVSFLEDNGERSAGKTLTPGGARTACRQAGVDVRTETTKSEVSGERPQGVTLDKLQSRQFRELRKDIDQAALLGIPILLVGPRGCGKTFLARYYHDRRMECRLRSPRRLPQHGGYRFPEHFGPGAKGAQFQEVNVAEFPLKSDIRDELFGWIEGAYTDAPYDYDGLIGCAHKGTLFLDEIHRLPADMQPVLLTVLNARTYRPRGSSELVYSDFDLVTATNDIKAYEHNLIPDLCDRMERLRLLVPSFAALTKDKAGRHDLWLFWEDAMQRACKESNIDYVAPDADCEGNLKFFLRGDEFKGNWRDLQRLATHILLYCAVGNPPQFNWDASQLQKALVRTVTRAVLPTESQTESEDVALQALAGPMDDDEW